MRIAMKKLFQFDYILFGTVAITGIWILGYSLGATIEVDNCIDWSSWVTAVTTLGIFAAAFLFRYDFQEQHIHQIRLEAAKEVITLQPKVHLMNCRIVLTEIRSHFGSIDTYIGDTSSHKKLFKSASECLKKLDVGLNALNHIATQSIALTSKASNPSITCFTEDYNNFVSETTRISAILNTLTLTKDTFDKVIQGKGDDKTALKLIDEMRQYDFSKTFDATKKLQRSSTILISYCLNELRGFN